MRFKTFLLSQENLKRAGINLDAMGITNRKNRPYVAVASNRQMTWLVPLTTVMKEAHGRIAVCHLVGVNAVECEAITSDMFSINTQTLEKVGIPRGVITYGKDKLIQQIQYSLECGILGRYPR